MFDPFFTTKPIGEGTGLGLSMVYGFARQSHGHVRIYSEVGQGTMVCIYLPRHDGPADEDAPALPLPAACAANGTVLVIDDEPSVRMLIVDTLTDLDYACSIEAGDKTLGAEAAAIGRGDKSAADHRRRPARGLNGRQIIDAASAHATPRSARSCSSPAMPRTPRSTTAISHMAWRC